MSDLLKAAGEAGLEGEVSEAILQDGTKNRRANNPNIRFYLALLGVLPWIGVLITATLGRWSEADQERLNVLHRGWLEEHEARFRELRRRTGTTDAHHFTQLIRSAARCPTSAPL